MNNLNLLENILDNIVHFLNILLEDQKHFNFYLSFMEKKLMSIQQIKTNINFHFYYTAPFFFIYTFVFNQSNSPPPPPLFTSSTDSFFDLTN